MLQAELPTDNGKEMGVVNSHHHLPEFVPHSALHMKELILSEEPWFTSESRDAESVGRDSSQVTEIGSPSPGRNPASLGGSLEGHAVRIRRWSLSS